MPQGKRKTPFSGKAKREQLQLKKNTKIRDNTADSASISKTIVTKTSHGEPSAGSLRATVKVNYQPSASSRNANKYALQFHRETDDEIKLRKEQARHTLKVKSGADLEIDPKTVFPKELDFPTRPKWSYEQSVDALNAAEHKYFTEYTKTIEKNYSGSELSYFELNLETWRQLWRVLEMADIVLLIVDIRFPALMFPPSLYEYITKVLHKHMILVLNKIDLASPAIVIAWRHYFQKQFPELHIVMFTTVPSYSLLGKQQDKAGLLIRRRKGRARMAAEASKQLIDTCKKIVDNKIDLSSWERKINDELNTALNDPSDQSLVIQAEHDIIMEKATTEYYKHEEYKDGILTIGCVGQPNVGKSSLLNSVMGQRVVSVSKTPGHTKHFQTIYITESVRFCDCPGLVFPSKVPKPLQILMGSFPIAQLREPFSTIQYLAERLPLPKLLRVHHPENEKEWSAMDVCDGWAKKNGYITAKAGRLDSYRAANSLLRMALDGKICLNLYPPGYFEKEEFWSSHPDIEIVKWIQALKESSADTKIIEEKHSDEESSGEQSVDSDSRPESSTKVRNTYSVLSHETD